MRSCLAACSVVLLFCVSAVRAAEVDYERDAAALLRTYCVACHGSDEPESGLVLESYAGLMKGGKHGPAIVAGNSKGSRLVMMLEGRAKPAMPPKDNEAPSADEIARLKRWIDAGAKPPSNPQAGAPMLVTPSIKPTAPVRPTITAAAISPDGKLLAIGRYGQVQLLTGAERAVYRTLAGLRGSITAVGFSADGTRLLAAGGEPGMQGQAWLWSVADGKLLQTFVGHKDSLYAAVISPDNALLATGSYDQQIKLWNTQTGKEVRTLAGHNGAIFDLAFHKNGRILASASADRTIKLWDATTGQRLDTFSQPLKDQHAVAFSPDGRFVAAGGVDNRIRIWKLSPTAKENTNPLIFTRFAHEGAVLKLAFSQNGKLLASSGEDRLVKLWETTNFTERSVLPSQSDWVAGLALNADGSRLLAGRIDGSLELIDTATGHAAPLARPELVMLEPRGIERGVPTRIKLRGRHLAALASGKLAAGKAKIADVKLLDPPAGPQAGRWVEILVPATTARGTYTLSLTGPGGTVEQPLLVDDLPQRSEQEPNDVPRSLSEQPLPVAVWGTISQAGDQDHVRFRGKAGQTIVLELDAAGIGSALNATLSLLNPAGEVVANNNDFDGRRDPLVAYRLPADGVYTARIQDQLLSGSGKHFYRLSAGELPVVTGVFPLGVPVGRATNLELAGYNLPSGAHATVHPTQAGDTPVVIDKRFRTLQALRVLATTENELAEHEPNDDPAHATPVAAPAHVSGRLWSGGGASSSAAADADLFRFTSKRGQSWVIETMAARRGSPADTRIDVLDAAAKQVDRLWMQAVLDSYVTFRGVSSDEQIIRVQNWEEMELNQYLYMQGEIGKFFRKPQGPDSGFQFYNEGGRRRCYFDTSPAAHALDEPCYIVQPQVPGTKLLPTGLPVFKLGYANDDASERKLGTDSRVMFTAPADGDYLVRVTESRSAGGDRFGYRLSIRTPQPDFEVRVAVPRAVVSAGSAASLVFRAERIDGFEDAITVDVQNLPTGFSIAGPIVIEAGHDEARLPLVAAKDAKAPPPARWADVRIAARGQVAGRPVEHETNKLPVLKLMPAPQVLVHLEPAVLDMVPGTTITARLRVERNGFADRLQFDVLNLPHGVIVDNIGLNGILIPAGQSEREIFLTADAWVPPVERPCFAATKNAGSAKGGNQDSPPLLLRVRPAGDTSGRTAGK